MTMLVDYTDVWLIKKRDTCYYYIIVKNTCSVICNSQTGQQTHGQTRAVSGIAVAYISFLKRR